MMKRFGLACKYLPPRSCSYSTSSGNSCSSNSRPSNDFNYSREFKEAFLSLSEDQRNRIEEMIRVNHAGEAGANTIYRGQYDILGRKDPKGLGILLQHMWDQEKEHLRVLEENFIPKFNVRPTLLLPIWMTAGYLLGAGTAALGKEAAMACTEAVEEVIGNHYNSQIRELTEMNLPMEIHKPLVETFRKFRDEELEHFNTSIENDAQKAPFHSGLNFLIKEGCKAAILIAKKI